MPIGQADRLMPTLRRVVLARQSAARSDGDLLGAFVLARDAEAFAELVRRHGPMVLGVCRRVVGDRTTADDAFQAAFLVLARRAASVRPRERVGNGLYGVAYRTALKARTVLARRRSREKQVDVMPESIAPGPAPAWTDLQPVIDEELARLPDKFRLPVVLCDLEGRPQREVAKHLNVAPATLATRLASARRTLAQRLTRRGVTLSGGALAGLLGVHASASAVPTALAAGVVRAVEAGAAGSAVGSLVSANALQLSEGVVRMMMIANLKAIALLAVTALALTTGLGLGLVPATAGDEPGPGAPVSAKVAGTATEPARPAARPKSAGQPDPKADDAAFLRRLCLDVRGTPPTDVETWFFVTDTDAEKRSKLVGWMTSDEATRAALAKKLGLPNNAKVLRARFSADKQVVELIVEGSGVRAVKQATVTNSSPVPGAVTTIDSTFDVSGGVVAHGEGAVDIDLRVDVQNKTEVKPQKVVSDRRVKLSQIAAITDWKVVPKPLVVGLDPIGLAVFGDDPRTVIINETNFSWEAVADSDVEFLKRVLADVRGNAPTALETKYFTEDKDPKKREKLLDTLLKDPAVQKKLGDAWKAKMLEPRAFSIHQAPEPHLERFMIWVQPEIKSQPAPAGAKPPASSPQAAKPSPPTPTAQNRVEPDKYEKLVVTLIATNKSDEAMLEAVTLATLSRLPTDSEKKLVVASIASTSDRKGAWLAVTRSLAGVEVKPAPIGVKVVIDPPAPKPPITPAKP